MIKNKNLNIKNVRKSRKGNQNRIPKQYKTAKKLEINKEEGEERSYESSSGIEEDGSLEEFDFDKDRSNAVQSKSSETMHVIQNKVAHDKLMKDYPAKDDLQYQVKKPSKKMLTKLKKIEERKRQCLPTKHPDAEKRTIFVGNVSVNTKRRKVETFFSQYGKVESVRYRGVAAEEIGITKKEAITKKRLHSKRKSLIAYVRFKEEESVEKALQANGMLFEDLHLRVDRSTHKKSKEKNSIFIGNLPWEVNEEDLWNFFKDCGQIANVRIVRSLTTGAGKGFAFIAFEEKEGVGRALKLNGKMFLNREIRVKKSVKKVKEKIAPVRGRVKSSMASLITKNTERKMNLNFLKNDKSQLKGKKKKEKRGQRKRLREAENTKDFSGMKAVDDETKIKKKRKQKTKQDKKNFVISKILGGK